MSNGVGASNFWARRRVLVTGHTGFKGGWLTHWLKYAGAEVTGYSLKPPSLPNLLTAANIAEGIHHFNGDICDRAALDSAFAQSSPEIVFHLAAQPLVRYSYEEPEETFTSNVIGSLNVLQAARYANTKAFVNVTTDKCYENREWFWPYRENEPLGGHDPYSASKACAELLSSSFRSSFLSKEGAMRLATARAGNVLGGGDWGLDRLVPDLMRAFSAGTEAKIRNPVAIRPWQHVLEALSGYLKLGQALLQDDGDRYCESWNFGPDSQHEKSVAAIADLACKHWGPGAKIRKLNAPNGPHEAHFLKLDSTKAHTMLGWHPHWNFEQALDETVKWYRRFYSGGSTEPKQMAALMSQQIDQYINNE